MIASKSQSFQDRRRDPRIDNNIPLKISSHDSDLVTETWNLSKSGVYCRVTQYVEPMTKLKIHLLLPVQKNGRRTTKKITCQGIIVRIEDVPGEAYYNAAVFFSDIQAKDADYISDFVHEELEKNQTADSKS